MRVRILPGNIAAFVGICGSGLLMKFPAYSDQIGTVLIVLSVFILVFSIRIDGAGLSIGRPNPLRSLWWSLGHRQVPFHEAARLAYEAMETSGVDDVTAGGYSNPITPLEHFKYVILSAAKQRRITLYGARLPSRQTLAIPAAIIPQLAPSKQDENGIDSISRAQPNDFRNVWLSRRELRRVINDRIALLERVNKGLSE